MSCRVCVTMVGLPFSSIVKSIFVGGERIVCCVQGGYRLCQFVLLC